MQGADTGLIALVWVRSEGQEPLRNLKAPLMHCPPERRAPPLVALVDSCSAFQKALDDLSVAQRRRAPKSCPAVGTEANRRGLVTDRGWGIAPHTQQILTHITVLTELTRPPRSLPGEGHGAIVPCLSIVPRVQSA